MTDNSATTADMLGQVLAKMEALTVAVRSQASEISQLKQQNQTTSQSHRLQHHADSDATISTIATAPPQPPQSSSARTLTSNPKLNTQDRKLFLPGEYVAIAFAPGSHSNPPEHVYQIISRLESGPGKDMWYRCHLLELAPQHFSPQVRELGFMASQVLTWCGASGSSKSKSTQVDLEHTDALRAVLVLTRLDHFRVAVLSGEAHKFILVGAVQANGRLADVQPASDGSRREVCCINGVHIPMPYTPRGSRSESFIRGRAALMKIFRDSMYERWRNMQTERGRSGGGGGSGEHDTDAGSIRSTATGGGGGASSSSGGSTEACVSLDPDAWLNGVFLPLCDVGLPRRRVEVLESIEYQDGVQNKKQVVTMVGTQLTCESAVHTRAVQHVLGRNALTLVLKKGRVVCLEHDAKPSLRLTYLGSPLFMLKLETVCGVYKIKGGSSTSVSSSSIGYDAKSLSPVRMSRTSVQVAASEQRSQSRSPGSKPSSLMGGSTGSERSPFVATGGQPGALDLLLSGSTNKSINTTTMSSRSSGGGNASINSNSGEKWSKEEQQRFVQALRLHGQGEWIKIADGVGTRTPQEVRDHGRKYLRRLASTNNGPAPQPYHRA